MFCMGHSVRLFHANLTKFGEFPMGNILEFDTFSSFVCITEK